MIFIRFQESIKIKFGALLRKLLLISCGPQLVAKNKNADKDRKGVLFVAVFRHREFEAYTRKMGPCKTCQVTMQTWTKAEYFIILYRYAFGRFIRLSRMETNFRYASKSRGYDLTTPIFKDLSALESDGDIILLSNSESEYFKLIFNEEKKDTELEGFEIPGIQLIPV